MSDTRRVSRRQFIQRAGAALGGAALSAAAAPWSSARAMCQANEWGCFDAAAAGFPASFGDGYKILEIFCVGGVSPWESFYLQGTTSAAYRNFDTDMERIFYNTAPALSYHAAPTNSGNVFSFGADAAGHPISLGPWVKPLWHNYTNITDRMRVVVLRHDLTPHEAAVPFALTGKPLGRPGFAHLGSHITRRDRFRTTPVDVPSFTLIDSYNIGRQKFQALRAVGQNDAGDRSLLLTFPGTVADDLLRPGRNDKQIQLLDLYTQMYRDRLTYPGQSTAARSKAFAAYADAVDRLVDAPGLHGQLAPILTGGAQLTPWYADFSDQIPPAQYTPDFTFGDANKRKNTIHRRLEAAAHLLSGQVNARHVFVTDNGLNRDYDSHTSTSKESMHCVRTPNNLWALTSALRALIEGGAIDLDDTMVVIKTEFGRAPIREDGGNGRDHWPEGYVNVLIGGPIQQSGVVGAIDPGDSEAIDGQYYTPADLQAATLLAAGVDPFASGLFKTEDLIGSLQSANPLLAMQNLRTTLLGGV